MLTIYFELFILLVGLLCAVVWYLPIAIKETNSEIIRKSLLVFVSFVGGFSLYLCDVAYGEHLADPEIYDSVFMCFFPLIMWGMMSLLLWGTYKRKVRKPE